jgi:hypothetical protein
MFRFLKQVRSARTSTSSRRSSVGRRLTLEALEDRLTPTIFGLGYPVIQVNPQPLPPAPPPTSVLLVMPVQAVSISSSVAGPSW